MTPEKKQIVQNTWQLVVPTADTAACLFYERLFEIDPTTRPLFKAEPLGSKNGSFCGFWALWCGAWTIWVT